ncbi:UDP-N-acetylglucosamine 1-carboxyvinyltransferase [bacterium]|nr:UDP-N-acetylglucosamine 1-carboxyvinyltransferase [bacterium]
MRERLIIQGGKQLKGEISPAGNKNEALAILAASLLTEEAVRLKNVPDICDVRDMVEIMRDIGVDVKRVGEHEYLIKALSIKKMELNPELCSRIRGSFLFAAPILVRCGKVKLPKPGGDKIGRRRIDTHLLALEALGTSVSVGNDYKLEIGTGFHGADIFLDEASVMATENTIMAAAFAKGKTTIVNAASEPHVQGLCKFLNSLGAKISGVGSNILTIEGVKQLCGGEYLISSDHIETGSFIGLAAATHSELLIKNAPVEHMKMIFLVLEKLGISLEIDKRDIFIPVRKKMKVVTDIGGAIPKIDDSPWPGFPADLVSIALVIATQSEGTVLIFEKMFESRLYFVDELINMGAKIVLCDPHRAVIVGPSDLHGCEIVSPDIRAGMALLIAALCAKGKSTIHNIRQIDRGYERIDQRLCSLGADIVRV